MVRRCLLILILFAFGCFNAGAQSRKAESNLKAAFIYNFTRYIEWDNATNDNFVIGILGPSPIYEPLIQIAKTKTVNNRKIVIKQFNKVDDISSCNILFISSSSNSPVSSVLSKVNKGTLTIGEEAGLAEQGTAFNFIVVNDKLKFEANVRSINEAGLKASSQLLKLARIVD